MRLSKTPRVCSALLSGLLVLLASCAKPSLQSLQSLAITATPSTVSVGGSVVLRAIAHLSDGSTQDVTSATQFTLSDPALAAVNSGVLTSKVAGSLTVQGAYVQVVPVGSGAAAASTPQTLSSSAQVTITAAGTTTTTPIITWSAPAPITAGTTLSSIQLDAQASVQGTFAYTPAAGAVLQAGIQTLTTTFTPSDTQHYSAATSSVQLTVLAAAPGTPITPTITWNTPASIVSGTALSSVQLNATANVPGTFTYVPGAGTVLAPGIQTLTTTFTPSDNQTYATATATVQIAVAAATAPPTIRVAPILTWPAPQPIAQGTALSNAQLNATANVPGTFTYAPAAGSVLQAGLQLLTTTFTPVDSTDYLTATASVQLAVLAPGPPPVNPVVPSITWSAPAAIVYGTALSGVQLNATAGVAGTFVYSPAAGTVLQAGAQTLTTTFTPADTTTYSIMTATVNLAVTQAKPVISWAAPAAIAQGTALSTAQLNATANVPGAFTYLPQAGTVPAAGTIQLNATFAPADAVDYTAATAQRSLSVTGASNPVPTGCGGPTINLNPGMSQGTLQNRIQTAPNCALILFAPGIYNFTATISVPCSANLTLTGPATTPATAILNALPSINQIFYISGCSGVTFEYLGFANTTGIYANVPAQGSSGITITHNQFFGLSGTAADYLAETGIYFTGYATGGTLSNVAVTWNNFGSPTDCAGAMTQLIDQGGYCSGVVFTASLDNIVVSNNTFLHLEEGFHVNCTKPGCVPPTGNTWKNFTAENNDFSEIHRIGMEMQPEASSNIVIQYNDEHDFLNGYNSTMGISSACCNDGANNPGTIDSNNVLIANNQAVPRPIPGNVFAIEFWGNGALAQGNLVQGYWAYGIAFGYAPNAIITGNNICGPVMASKNSYVANEEHQATPTIVPNTTSPTCSAVTSTPPSISPVSGTITGLTTVTLSDGGVNHSIYYTLDGSTPSTSSTLYTSPFAVAPGTTVNAIGMWGQGANAKSYPAGYGYVPSDVISATYLDGSLAKPVKTKTAISSAAGTIAPHGALAAILDSVTVTPTQAVVGIGSSMQLKATANYSDGTTRDVTAQFAWLSSDQRTMRVSALGMVSGIATGQANISGVWQGHAVSVPALSSIGQLTWSAPIVISRGGTYSGNWSSNDPDTAAVTIATSEPVVIENAHMRSVTSLIHTPVTGANLTVRNSVAVALPSPLKGQPGGVFLEVTSPARLDVENNYLENVSGGVVVHGYSGKRDQESTIVIRGNRGRNIRGANSSTNHLLPSASFIELDGLQTVPGIDVGWNEVINYAGSSLVGDNIRVYQSSGTPNRPLDIHDTYIQGAYPLAPAPYNGGGIRIDGTVSDTAPSAFNSVHDNQIVATGSHGILLAAGHDNLAFNNRVLSSGLLADGIRLTSASVGITNSAGPNQSSANSYNNSMHDNLVGWMCWQAACESNAFRNDAYLPSAPRDYSINTRMATEVITLNMEQSEYALWLNKLASNGMSVGPSF